MQNFGRFKKKIPTLINLIPAKINTLDRWNWILCESRKIRDITFLWTLLCITILLFYLYRIQVYKYNCGGNLGNLTFVWKIHDHVDQARQLLTIEEVKKSVPKFETEALARKMREKYCNISGVTPVVRRSMVEFLTGKKAQ